MEPYDFTELDSKGRQPAILHRSDWGTDDDLWKGVFEGKSFGKIR